MKNDKKSILIKPCPCCEKQAEWVDLKVGNIILWQISCNSCGLSSFPENCKVKTLKQWNNRPQKFVFTIAGAALLILFLVSIISFIIGMIVAN